ncbi:formyltetrahydrofolate deformylase [Gilvimarinus sp. F26214L]|uniref:formyltetrahydrofolate deformylase n=1 Tax=Gilvimarinus sp. DZF01 TaxID=3461371 RepID=UPI00404583A5
MNETSDGQSSEMVLRFSCADQPGIVATVAGFFCEQGFNIRESSQFEDRDSCQFFMRTVFESSDGKAKSLARLQEQFASVASHYGMDWELHDRGYRPRILIAVSKWGHCLNNILNSWKLGSLPVEIVGVVSNHNTMRDLVEWYGLPFHHFPVSPGNKADQEAKILDLFTDTGSDLLVLARYMQILSDEACTTLAGRAINIHHSFLPGFKGARPYHQAYARGVKLIGATAHYVTSDLDEGPIIEQAVERVSHANTPEQLVEIGRDIEAIVLQRAVLWHVEHRVLLNGNKTVVFKP